MAWDTETNMAEDYWKHLNDIWDKKLRDIKKGQPIQQVWDGKPVELGATQAAYYYPTNQGKTIDPQSNAFARLPAVGWGTLEWTQANPWAKPEEPKLKMNAHYSEPLPLP